MNPSSFTGLPPIRFYLPDTIPPDMPRSPDVFWTGFAGKMRSGVYAWTVQTCLRLQQSGFPCELVGEMPADGIVVAHRKSLGRKFRPSPRLLLVCLKADATFHPYAHLHVVLNHGDLHRWHPATYIPHWPQPGLIPRDAARGEAWENAAFFGDPGSIASEMRGAAWEQTLRDLQLTWDAVEPARWHDFSRVDVVVAVRSFDDRGWANKPPTKLYNAWHAGVPAVLGPELAYRHERRSELDYLEARSLPELVAALQRLKADPELRRRMVENGRVRARESAPAVITGRWQDFFLTTAVPAYERWLRAAPRARTAFYCNGLLKSAVATVQGKLGALRQGAHL